MSKTRPNRGSRAIRRHCQDRNKVTTEGQSKEFHSSVPFKWIKPGFQIIERAVKNSFGFGVYLNNSQVGFARLITDFSVFAHLADLFIIEEHRGKGLSKWLMHEIINHPKVQGLRKWTLATVDAHNLYKKFGFTEVLLGLIPAVISPYVIAKIGETHARATFLSGKRFDAEKALTMGLIHEIEDGDEEIEYFLDKAVDNFLKAGPTAAIEAKKLIKQVVDFANDNMAKTKYTCEAIANRRVHSEGQEGMSALLEKRNANWIVSDE